MANTGDFGQGFVAAVAAAESGVVRVEGDGRYPASGSVWNEELVLSSQHSLADAEELRVTLADGSQHAAELVGRDPSLDLALLRVKGAKLTPLSFAKGGELHVGQWVVALARPGQAIRASARIIGVLGKEQRTALGGKLDRYIESDRGFPRGFRGGPLVDLEGRAIGLNTDALLRGADLTLPGETLERAVGELLAHGKVRRGYLGVSVQPVRLPESAAKQSGRDRALLILRVEAGSPAETAGLLLGDALVEIGGKPVTDPRELSAVLHDAIGRQQPARIVRAGAVQTLEVAAGERP